MAKSIVIVGLGRFGSALAKTLTEMGDDVLGIDIASEKVRDLGDSVGKVVQGNGASQELWKDLPLKGVDVGIVAFGSQLETNLMTAMLLKKTSIRYVIARSENDLHSELLRRLGVNEVIEPEVDSALRLAHTLGSRLHNYLQVTEDFGITRITADGHLHKITIEKLNKDQKVTALVLCRGNRLILEPSDREQISAGDTLIVAGKDEDLRELAEIQ